MKNLSLFAILLSVCIILSSCSGPAASSDISGEGNSPEASASVAQNPDSPATESQDNAAGEEKHLGEVINQINSLYANLDRSRLPLRENWMAVTQDYNRDDMPPQLIYDEDEAYYLAKCIQNLLYPSGNILTDFYGPQNGLGSGALETAIYKTQPIEWAWEVEYGIGVTGTKYPDHVLTALIDRETKEGRYPADLMYAEDVAKTMVYLFGVADMDANVDGIHGRYQAEEVFVRFGEFGGPYRPYPQIISYEKTSDGYVCEAVIVQAVDREFPMYSGNSVEDLTRQNFETETLSCDKFRYAFTKSEDGHLVLTAFKTLRTQEPDKGGSVVEYTEPNFMDNAGFNIKAWPTQKLTRCALIDGDVAELNLSWDEANPLTLQVFRGDYVYVRDYSFADFSENLTKTIDGTEVEISFSAGGPMTAGWLKNGYSFALSQWKGDFSLESFQECVEKFVRKTVMEPETAE